MWQDMLCFGLDIVTENVLNNETQKQFYNLLSWIHPEILSQLAQLSSHIQHCFDRTKTSCPFFIILSEAHHRNISWGHSGTYTGISDKITTGSVPLWGIWNSSAFCLFWKKQLNCEHATLSIINADIWLQNIDESGGMSDTTTFFMDLRYFLALSISLKLHKQTAQKASFPASNWSEHCKTQPLVHA